MGDADDDVAARGRSSRRPRATATSRAGVRRASRSRTCVPVDRGAPPDRGGLVGVPGATRAAQRRARARNLHGQPPGPLLGEQGRELRCQAAPRAPRPRQPRAQSPAKSVRPARGPRIQPREPRREHAGERLSMAPMRRTSRRPASVPPAGPRCVVRRVRAARRAVPLPGEHRLRARGLAHGRRARLPEHADLGPRVERSPSTWPHSRVAHRVGPTSPAASASARRGGSANGRSKMQCPRPGAPGSAWSVRMDHRAGNSSGSQVSKTSVPSSRSGSSAPRTMTARIAWPRGRGRRDVRAVLDLAQNQEVAVAVTTSTHRSAKRASVTTAAPKGVATSSAGPHEFGSA